MSNPKKSTAKKSVEKSTAKKSVEKVSLAELLEEAQDLNLDSDKILSLVTDLSALEKFIQDEKSRISELEGIDSLIRESSLGKAKLNLMGLALHGSWNQYTVATTGWLRQFAEMAMTSQWIEFTLSKKRLKDVEKFVSWYEKNF